MREVDAMLKGGGDRARQLCAAELAKDYYLTGCPLWSNSRTGHIRAKAGKRACLLRRS
jgi:hypothetical protein